LSLIYLGEYLKEIDLPKTLTTDLAYLTGFINGDGHLCYRKNKNEYAIFCSGNLKDEKEFYDKILIPLFKKIFNIKMKVKVQKSNNTYNIVFYSKVLLEYMTKELSIPIGSKSGKIRIPDFIKKSNDFMIKFICGFADADFSLTLKKRYREIPYYPVISGSSKSPYIIEDISYFLEYNKIPFYKEINKTIYDKRYGYSKISTITIYGHNNLVKWMKLIGFRNTKILKKIDMWKEINKNNKRAQDALKIINSSGERI
jgi:hypothetical protein